MKFLEAWSNDRAFPMSEVVELMEGALSPGARTTKVSARLRSGEVVRINGNTLLEVLSGLADVQPATPGLWKMRAIHEPELSRPGHPAFSIVSEPVLAWNFSDAGFPEPIGPTGLGTIGKQAASFFVTDGARAWTACRPRTGCAWQGSIAEAINEMGMELAARLAPHADLIEAPALEDVI